MSASQPLIGRHSVVTGAGGGMGRAHALRLARLSADVVVVDRDLVAWRRWDEDVTAGSVVAEIESLGCRPMGVQADLSDPAKADDAITRAVDAFGSIDALVNNAGGAITPIGRSQASICSPEDTELLWRANMLTTINCNSPGAHRDRPHQVSRCPAWPRHPRTNRRSCTAALRDNRRRRRRRRVPGHRPVRVRHRRVHPGHGGTQLVMAMGS